MLWEKVESLPKTNENYDKPNTVRKHIRCKDRVLNK